jgi:hypothetical protein
MYLYLQKIRFARWEELYRCGILIFRVAEDISFQESRTMLCFFSDKNVPILLRLANINAQRQQNSVLIFLLYLVFFCHVTCMNQEPGYL